MKDYQQLTEYLDSEGIVPRRDNEILEIVEKAGGNRAKIDSFLKREFSPNDEQDRYDYIFEYAGNAPIYDLLKGQTRDLTEWMLKKATDSHVPGRILDIGCGTGLEACFFGELSKSEVMGIDINQKALIESQKRIKRRGIKNVNVAIGSRNKLDFPEGYFDFVTSFSSIVSEEEAYTEDPHSEYTFLIKSRVKKIARILKNNGVSAITFPAPEGYEDFYEEVLAESFNEAGFSKILDEEQKSFNCYGCCFTGIFVSARK
jgi:ubiquinone/menaquinone biosynthesis C-methylase UbiE